MSDNLYFEPSSRLQLVDKLAHLLRFSNTFLVLTGSPGAGSTTLLEQLHNRAIADDLYIISLTLESDTGRNALLAMLNSSLDELLDVADDAAHTDALSALHDRIATITALQRKILISIDNSDSLGDDATLILLNLLVANQGMISIVVAGSQVLTARTAVLTRQEGVPENYYVEVLGPFNRSETEEFIQLNFARGNHFSNRQIDSIFRRSEGYPGRICAITSQLIKAGKATRGSWFSVLPIPHMLGVFFLLSAITGVSLWQSFSDDSPRIQSAGQAQIVNISQVEDLELELGKHSNQAKSLEDEIASLSSEIQSQQALIERAERNVINNDSVDIANQLSVIDSQETLIADSGSVSDSLQLMTGSVTEQQSGIDDQQAGVAQDSDQSDIAPAPLQLKAPAAQGQLSEVDGLSFETPVTDNAEPKLAKLILATPSDQTESLDDDVGRSTSQIQSPQELIGAIEQSVLNNDPVDVARQLSLVGSQKITSLAAGTKNNNAQPVIAPVTDQQGAVDNQQIVAAQTSEQSTITLVKTKVQTLAPKGRSSEIDGLLVETPVTTNALVALDEEQSKIQSPLVTNLRQLSSQLKKNIDPSLLQQPRVVSSSAGVSTNAVVVIEASAPAGQQTLSVVNVASQQVPPTKDASGLGALVSQASAIKKWPLDTYTLQLVSVKSKANVGRFLQSTANAEKMRYIQTLVKGKVWHVVIYGQYASSALAIAALAKLPAQLQALKPWPRSVEGIKSSIRN